MIKTCCALTIVGLLLMVPSSYAGVVPHETYDDCIVHEVRINPCNITGPNGRCGLRGINYLRVNFDYTTNFNASILESQIFLTAKAVWPKLIPLQITAEPVFWNACEYTSCPAEAGKRATFADVVFIPRSAIELRKTWGMIGILRVMEPEHKCRFTIDDQLLDFGVWSE